MSAFNVDISSPFPTGKLTGGLGGPGEGGHAANDPVEKWYNYYGMDLAVPTGTEVRAAFGDAHITKYKPHNPATDSAAEYGAELFMRYTGDKMGGFYTHITNVPPGLAVGGTVHRGALLGTTMSSHLHMALVEIVGGLPGGKYKGVDLYKFLLNKWMADPNAVTQVTFKQDGTPPVPQP